MEGFAFQQAELTRAQHAIESFYIRNESCFISRTPDSKIPNDQLNDLKDQLIKLKALLYNSLNECKQRMEPVTKAIEKVQTQQFLAATINREPPKQESMKNKQVQSQKTSAQRRNSTRTNSRFDQRGSERTVRPRTRTPQASCRNPLDIWSRSEPLFSQLPSQEEISTIFSTAIQNSLKNTMIKLEDYPVSNQHWGSAMYERVMRMPRDSKRVPKLMPPPGPPPSSDSLSEYWVSNPPNFPIETVQKHNDSVMHHLLAAIVEVDPSALSEKKEKKPYLPLHVLSPRLKSSRYLSLNFETRLNTELQAVGLNESSGGSRNDNEKLRNEVEKMKDKIKELVPLVELDARELINDIQKYREVEDQQFLDDARFNEMYQLIQCKRKK